jgi:hypothetical protein
VVYLGKDIPFIAQVETLFLVGGWLIVENGFNHDLLRKINGKTGATSESEI